MLLIGLVVVGVARERLLHRRCQRSAAWCCVSASLSRQPTPGPRWHLPFPIESAEVVNVSQVRTVEIGYRDNVKNKVLKESLMLTDDENIIDMQFAVQYILKRPRGLTCSTTAARTTRCCRLPKPRFAKSSARARWTSCCTKGARRSPRAAKLMQEILDRYKTGISVSKVTMQNAQPPEQVQAAFDDAVKAGQDRERQKNEGQAYANDVVPRRAARRRA